MKAVKINIKVESDTIKIPELKKFIGKRIEIILIDDSNDNKQRKARYRKIKDLKGKIEFNDHALTELRKKSIL